jgi:hypothetical protein
MQKYCDIMPDATGWVYVIDGVQSASYHHTFELAVEAAKSNFQHVGRKEERVFRLQDCSGRLRPISDPASQRSGDRSAPEG